MSRARKSSSSGKPLPKATITQKSPFEKLTGCPDETVAELDEPTPIYDEVTAWLAAQSGGES